MTAHNRNMTHLKHLRMSSVFDPFANRFCSLPSAGTLWSRNVLAVEWIPGSIINVSTRYRDVFAVDTFQFMSNGRKAPHDINSVGQVSSLIGRNRLNFFFLPMYLLRVVHEMYFNKFSGFYSNKCFLLEERVKDRYTVTFTITLTPLKFKQWQIVVYYLFLIKESNKSNQLYHLLFVLGITNL